MLLKYCFLGCINNAPKAFFRFMHPKLALPAHIQRLTTPTELGSARGALAG